MFMILGKIFCIHTSFKYITKTEIENFVQKLANHDFVQEDFKKIINTINYGMMQLEIQPWLK